MDNLTQRISYLLRSYLFKLSHLHRLVCHTQTYLKWYHTQLNRSTYSWLYVRYPCHRVWRTAVSIWGYIWLVQLADQADRLSEGKTLYFYTNPKTTYSCDTGQCTHQVPTHHRYDSHQPVTDCGYHKKAIQVERRQYTAHPQSIPPTHNTTTHYSKLYADRQERNTLYALWYCRLAFSHAGL